MISFHDSGGKLLWLWRRWLVFILLCAAQHLVRDILQDVLDIHNGFTEFAHREPDPARLPPRLKWLLFGGYGKWTTFPVEIFLLWAIPRVWKRGRWSRLDAVIFAVLLATGTTWLLGYRYS